jgi:hypothetical protein
MTPKAFLCELLILKHKNDKAGIEVIGLDDLIVYAKVMLEEEDVAYVEKMIAELK